MKRKEPTNDHQESHKNSSLMDMIRNQKDRRKRVKQYENNSFLVDTLHGIYSEKRELQQQDNTQLFNQVTIGMVCECLNGDHHQEVSLEIFREKIEKYIVHSTHYRDDTNLINQFIVYHIYLAQEIFLCFLKGKSESAAVKNRLIEIGLKRMLAFENAERSIIEYYFIRFFKFLNGEYIRSVVDKNVWMYMLSDMDFLQLTSSGIQKLFNVSSEGPLTLHSTTLSILQESQILSIPKFIMSCSDYFIDNMVGRMILENHSFESNHNIVQHFENVSYHCIWFITFYDKKRDTSKLMRFISNFRKVYSVENSKPLMIWEKLATSTSPIRLKSYITLLKSSKKIIDKSLFHSFVLNEFYNLFQVNGKQSSEEIMQNNKEPIYLTTELDSEKLQDDVFQWIIDNLENFYGNMYDILKELFSHPNLDFRTLANFINKLLKQQESTILKLIDEFTLDCINREDISGCINCLIISRNVFPIPKSIRPKNSVATGNQHLSTIDQWMKDNFFIYLSSGGTNTAIERNTRHASFVTKLFDNIIPSENTLFLTIYQKILNNLVNSRHELVSILLTKLKKTLQQSEMQTDQDSSADLDYEEVKSILLEYEKFGENVYNTSSKSSILPLTYYPVMKKTRWCNVIVPHLLSFSLRDTNDGLQKTKFEKLKSALISSLANRKLIPKDIMTHENPKEDSQGKETISSSVHLKVAMVEGCLLRVVSEIENQIKKQLTSIDSLLALFFECHTSITDIIQLLKSESVDTKTTQTTNNKLVEIVLQSFYDCCMVMGSFSQHEGLFVTILSEGNSQLSDSSSQRKRNHLDWIVLFKISVLMPLASISHLLKDRVLQLLKNINSKESNSDLIFTLSVLLSSLITVSTNEITIIQEFIELTNKGKEHMTSNILKKALQDRMALTKVCFSIWDEIKPKNFSDSFLFSKLIISSLEVCHHLQNYNSDFGESSNIIDCVSHNILEETFQKSIIDHFTPPQNGLNEFFCFVPSKMQILHFWITSRYSLILSQLDISSRKNEKAHQFLNVINQGNLKLEQVKSLISCIHVSFKNEFIENIFTRIAFLDFEDWISYEIGINDNICSNILFLYYKTQFLQYHTLLSSKYSQNSFPSMLSILFSKYFSTKKQDDHHSIMIQALIGLIPKFSTNEVLCKQDQFWIFRSWIRAIQSSNQNSRKCLYDFVTFTDHVDPIIYFMGTYSLSMFSQDFDFNVKTLRNTLADFSETCLDPLSHLHPWPVVFTSKLLEGLFSLVIISLGWPTKRENSQKELTKIFSNFITRNLVFKLNITRTLSLHVSNLETWIFNYFSNSQSNREALLLESKEMLSQIVSELEKDYSFGMKFMDVSQSTALTELVGKVDPKFGGLLISDMLISLFVKPKASNYLDPFYELKEKTINHDGHLLSRVAIHSQTILEYLDETKILYTTDTARLSQIIELVFDRIGSLLNTETWFDFFQHFISSLVTHYLSFVKQLENSNDATIPNSPLKNINQDIPRILETLIHQILLSNPVNFVPLAEQVIGNNSTGDENTNQQAEYQWLTTIALMQIILANDEIIKCILNPQDNTNSPWSALTSSTEFQNILSNLLDNINSMAMNNEITVKSQKIKLDTMTSTALNLARKLIQKQLLSESSIEAIN